MKNSLLFTFLLVTFLIPNIAHSEQQIITLKDGSQIKGELVGVGNGKYNVQTSTMGKVDVDTAQVVSISSQGVQAQSGVGFTSSPSVQGSDDFNQRITETQNKLMNDPQALNQIMEMTKDPELMKLLSDPSITQAAAARDVKALENNPKARELMKDPKVRKLMESLSSK